MADAQIWTMFFNQVIVALPLPQPRMQALLGVNLGTNPAVCVL